MTIQNLYYFAEITKDLNLGITAKRLFTTQQALSGHIRRLEEHYGVVLFTRKPRFALTDEGQALLRSANKMIAIENGLKSEFDALKHSVRGTIRVACSVTRSRLYVPEILSAFSRKYPAVQVQFLNENAFRGGQALSRDDVDFILSNYSIEGDGVKSIFLLKNPGLLMISDSLLREYLGNDISDFVKHAEAGLSISELPSEIPFIVTGIDGTESWQYAFLPELHERSSIYVDNNAVDVPIRMVQMGQGATLISKMYAEFIIKTFTPEFLEDVYFFPLLANGSRFVVTDALSFRSDMIMPEYCEEFIRIIEQVFANIRKQGYYSY